MGNDTTLCPQETFEINATTPCAIPAAYHWNNGSTDSVIIVSTAGYYSVEVDIGCGSINDNINFNFFVLFVLFKHTIY